MFNITKNKKCNIKINDIKINDKIEIECVEKGSYIPKSKIKEKIKEIEELPIIEEPHKIEYEERKMQFAINVLKELLESEG